MKNEYNKGTYYLLLILILIIIYFIMMMILLKDYNKGFKNTTQKNIYTITIQSLKYMKDPKSYK